MEHVLSNHGNTVVPFLNEPLLPENRKYLAPQIRSMNNRIHSEAKLPLANHIVTNKSSANREMPLFSRLYPSFGYLRKIFPPSGLKYFLLWSPKRLAISDHADSDMQFNCVKDVACDASGL